MLALLSVAAAAPPPSDADIVVLARKMRFIKVDIKAPRRKGVLVMERCRVTRGSGNSELDAVPCAAAQSCMVTPPTTRKILQICTEEQSQVRLDAIAARWRAEREGQP